MTQDHSASLARLNDLRATDPHAVFAELIRAGFETLVENSLKGATRSNPTPVSAADMRILLRDVFTGKAL